MNGWMDEQMSEWMNEQIYWLICQWVLYCSSNALNAWMLVYVKPSTHGLEWMKGWMHKWINWTSKQMKEWMNVQAYFRLKT